MHACQLDRKCRIQQPTAHRVPSSSIAIRVPSATEDAGSNPAWANMKPESIDPISSDEAALPGGSHHGEPELLRRDLWLLDCFRLWVETVRGTTSPRGGGYPENWFPGQVDCAKSRLFWRIRTGKAPLPYPPPTCYSCPWYELIEEPGPHTTQPLKIVDDRFRRPHFDPAVVSIETLVKSAYVAQCRYEVAEVNTLEGEANAAIISYGPYRFRAWNAPREYASISPTAIEGKVRELGGYITYIGLAK